MRNEDAGKGWDVEFCLFGIPVQIKPACWLLLALLGGGLSADRADVFAVLSFIAAGVLCLLSHELGHALVGRRLYGGYAVIILSGTGGETVSTGSPDSRLQEFLMVLAGPVCTLVPGVLCAWVLAGLIGDVRSAFLYFLLEPLPGVELPAAVQAALQPGGAAGALCSFLMPFFRMVACVGMWLCLFNLLPILPLDGGRLAGALTNKPRAVAMLGLVLCVPAVVWSLARGLWCNTLFMGYLAYLNFHAVGRK
ncbi:MAG: site-2 protease family protein [Akkermansia muciniphila]